MAPETDTLLRRVAGRKRLALLGSMSTYRLVLVLAVVYGVLLLC